MSEAWFLLDSGPGAPADNMALDEVLLQHVAELGAPVLRFYGWTAPAATFGYFQKIGEIESWTTLRPLIRRPTGGGLVPHDADWTYSFAVPPGHWWFKLRAEESYRCLHEWIRDAFAGVQLATELAPCCDKQLPGRCFAGPEKFDLVVRGVKLAGAAQRRTRDGLLIQGSIQPVPPNVARNAWQRALLERASEKWEVRWSALQLDAGWEAEVRVLAAGRYTRDEFNRRR
jgi:lipoate-protein ligase A